MLDTAAEADQAGGASEVGRGEIRRWRDLYASAEVEDAVDSERLLMAEVKTGPRGRAPRRGRAKTALRAAMVNEGLCRLTVQLIWELLLQRRSM